MMKKHRPETFNVLLKLFIALMFLIGFLVFFYPFAADSVINFAYQGQIKKVAQENSRNADRQAAKITRLQKENRQKSLENQQIGISPIKDILGRAVKRVPNKSRQYYYQHSLGSIFIPKISLSLPIFDKTNDTLLEKGITLLDGSSYPTGGSSTHAVLLGHNGLPDQQLFTHIDRLKKGDKFFLKILGKRLAYQVFDIKVVRPDDLKDVQIKQDQDLVTLVTCTPYMINTHRLLVTGRHVGLDKRQFDRAQKKTVSTQTTYLTFYLSLIAAALLLFIYFVYWQIRRFYRDKAKEQP
ncbi:MAG: class C sortase [Oenococcus sp.]|uniref:class C sortase n=2 Tax=Lactobacillaceae TaxID=33958 RepID=UPI0039E96084